MLKFQVLELEIECSSVPVDISIPLNFPPLVSCFGIRSMVDERILSISEGASVNCSKLMITPHAHGTHTECITHISKCETNMSTVQYGAHSLALLIRCEISNRSDTNETCPRNSKAIDRVITRNSVEYVMQKYENLKTHINAIMIRTYASDLQFPIDFTNTNPAYFTKEAMSLISEWSDHVLVDLPSIDREDDGGDLLAHKAFFNNNTNKLVTELCRFPDSLDEGLYMLTMSLPRWNTDAVPTQPLVSRVKRMSNCIFCKIIQGTIPSFKIYENELTYAFMDIQPLSMGHILVIPKTHAQFFHEVPDENLQDLLPVAKKIASVFHKKGAYNILQNNGRLANQAVDHVHFHIIPKNSEEDGLGVRWNSMKPNMEDLKKLADEIQSKIPA
ncbi:HIT-like protein [Rozella allomycis CSF55]|uniref:HIT-like protein n=1 Tax=Rozella allomycis (strain CSF55) TaxID=988480 RepID=A0A4P9YDD6_ROZAC|nr:HIT-like protein [Rozella allomycis CSF55]